MSTTDPDQIRADIEATRARLSADVDTLSDEANPATIAKRKVESVKDTAAGLRDRVMGSADDAKDAAGNAPGAVKAKTQGNPLAAGVIGFGVGMLIAALLPSSEQEQQAVTALKEKAEPAKQQLADAAKDAAAELKPAAQDAAASIKDTATEAVQQVKAEGRSAGQDVTDQAGASKDAVQGTAS